MVGKENASSRRQAKLSSGFASVKWAFWVDIAQRSAQRIRKESSAVGMAHAAYHQTMPEQNASVKRGTRALIAQIVFARARRGYSTQRLESVLVEKVNSVAPRKLSAWLQ